MTQKKQNLTKKKFNYTKWAFMLGTPIAFLTLLVGITTIPKEIKCNLGLKTKSCTEKKEVVEIITQTEAGESLGGVKIQFISQGAPEIQYTDNNGFARVQIPSRGDVNLNLTKNGFPPQNFTIDLDNKQSRTRIVRFQKSGVPEITKLPPRTSPTPILTSSPVNIPTSITNTPPIDRPIHRKKSTPLWKTKCDSATTGTPIYRILGTPTNTSVTFGREVFPLVAYIPNDNYSYFSTEKPVEFVCNVGSSYQKLNLIFGVYSANKYALPTNKILFQVFLDGQLAGKKEVVVGPKQEWKLNLQGVKNVSLRVECISESRCPNLIFSEMSLQ